MLTVDRGCNAGLPQCASNPYPKEPVIKASAMPPSPPITASRVDPGLYAMQIFAPVFALFLVLPGCAGGSFSSNGDTRAGLVCVDDSSTCISRRQRALSELTSSPDRSWIRERATPRMYAAGVRMFALKAKRNELTCAELKLARAEAARAPGVLKSGSSAGLTPAQISRGKMLASEVSRDLSREAGRRCR